MNLFLELSGIIAVATLLGFLMKFLKQPFFVGYILAGILAGPSVFNFLHAHEQIDAFSKIGITILLFILGLDLNPKVIREVGKAALGMGVGQIVITTVLGYGLALLLGLDQISALYVSIGLTFSSTIIVLKLLYDKGDLNKLYGKISVGFLLVQDIAATIALLFASSLGKTSDITISSLILLLFVKSLFLFLFLAFAGAYIVPLLARFSAVSKELLFLFSIAWGFGLSSIFYLLGFSIEIGALLAGVILSLTPFAYQIAARLKPLRDFFIVLFFVLLGSQMVFKDLASMVLPAVVFSLFVLIGKPLIMIVLMKILRYRNRTSFMTGAANAQVSEFSLILAGLGVTLGHIGQETLSLLTMVGLITIAGSTYFVVYGEKIYPLFEKLFRLLGLAKTGKKEGVLEEEAYDAILFGYDRVGRDFVQAFGKLGLKFLIVDFNPTLIDRILEEGLPHRFGDAEDIEFLRELNLAKVKMVVSTIPDFKTNMLLTKQLKEANPKAISIVLSHQVSYAEELYKAGAIYVVMPKYLGAQYASDMIVRLGLDVDAFKEEREKHREHLSKKYSR